ncbi:MAG TPA: DEAD/DEAH box helicase [Usitatibacter sp.]|nr:DEAD/DEAH box helicase [Usitatibacter sp.]
MAVSPQASPVSLDQFLVAVTHVIKRPLNLEQAAATKRDTAQPLMIVAGPGSGKTTVLVLRALRHVFVDGMLPEQVLITTFTKKAATELRSRLIEWGLGLHEELQKVAGPGAAGFFDAIDINRFLTGTLDSICEEWLGNSRAPGEVAPVVIEGFAANQVFSRQVFYAKHGANEALVRAFLARYTFDGKAPTTRGGTIRVLRPLLDRLVHDLVDLDSYAKAAGPDQAARAVVVQALRDYHAHLAATSQCDFALLESTFRTKLESGGLDEFVKQLRAILVDEYQDTNPLQEAIYFALTKRSNAALTIVGDDDQGLYRFRGATVELFRDFVARYKQRFPAASPVMEYLSKNYRSVPEITDFFNRYITNDASFAHARVKPLKPAIGPTRPSQGLPILGMFRDTAGDLAVDLAQLLEEVFVKGGYKANSFGTAVEIKPGANGGALGDAVLLGATVQEVSEPSFGQPGTPRFAFHLRQELAARGMHVFNPRGRALRDIEAVQTLMGLVLECLDPGGALTAAMFLTNTAKDYFARWRQAATQFIATNPLPSHPHTLGDFVKAWQKCSPLTGTTAWPREWPLLELGYTLITWLPQFQEDPEHQVYLEAITRAIAQAATFSVYRSKIVFIPPHYDQSRQAALRDVLAPLAEDLVEVDEEILTAVPRDRLNVMTVHQAKGLEFPLVIVDVGSRYRTNHRTQTFSRFPTTASATQLMEDDVASHSEVGKLRQTRNGLERAFEDLIRLHYVAYSRPQTALLLIGCTKCIEYNTSIKHVGLMWGSDGTWTWRAPFATKKPPPLVNNHPLALI